MAQEKPKKKYKKKFKDTKVGKFLLEKVPDLVAPVANILPDNGVMGLVKNIIQSTDKLSEQDKEQAMKLLEMDLLEMKSITKRWQADMTSDSWLSKNVRPLTLSFLTLMMTVFVIFDAHGYSDFTVKESWISLLETLLVTVYISYFGSRGFEKYTKIKSENNA
jgi:hypothetical protein